MTQENLVKHSNNYDSVHIDTSYILLILFYLFLLVVFLFNALIVKLPANASEVLLRDIPPAEFKKADLFYPEKNPFIYKDLPITIRVSPSISDTTISAVPTSLTATVNISITPSGNEEYTVMPTTTNDATPSASTGVGVSPTISSSTVVTSPSVSPSISEASGDSTSTPTPTPTPETT